MKPARPNRPNQITSNQSIPKCNTKSDESTWPGNMTRHKRGPVTRGPQTTANPRTRDSSFTFESRNARILQALVNIDENAPIGTSNEITDDSFGQGAHDAWVLSH